MAPSTKATTSTSTSTNDIRYSTLQGSHSWETGVRNRLPWLGVLSLLGTVACLGFNVAILVVSNQSPTSSWRIQPSVLLAISSAISTGLLRFATAEGAAVSWWLKAIDGCTVTDLHRYWSFSSNIWDAVRQIRYCNLLTLACIASVIVAIDGPLFQRASTISVQPLRTNMVLSVSIAQQLPEGYTGMLQGFINPVVAGMTDTFQQVVQGYTAREPMYLNHTGCGGGNCSVTIRAAGLAVNCSQVSLPWDFGSTQISGENGSLVGSDYDGPVVGMTNVEKTTFATNFTFDPQQPSAVHFTAAYKDQAPCKSRFQVNRCAFQVATLWYPITIENGVVQFSASLSNLGATPESVAAVYEISNNEATGDSSTLGGVYLAASNVLTSQATALQNNHVWTLNTSGTLAQDHITSIDSMTACQDTWSDPTPQVISTLQEIMFRAALSAANDSAPLKWYTGVADNATHVQTQQSIDAVQVALQPVFLLHCGYLAAGVVVMVACMVAVASTFGGWWRIGRDITMSPIEIAKAFNAPVLQGTGLNSDLNGLLPVVGNRRVRYGEVRYQDGKMLFPEECVEGAEGVQARLELSHLHWTSVPRQGVQYV